MLNLYRSSGKPAAYGAVRFPGSMRTPAKWACASSDQEKHGVGSMVKLLSNTWKLHKPSVIISVTGKAEGMLPMTEKQQRVVRRGLMRAVGRTKAWVLTDGLNSGAARLVGRAVHESGDTHTHVVGISDWHNVRHRRQLEVKGDGKVRHAPSAHAHLFSLPRARPRRPLLRPRLRRRCAATAR